MKTSSVYDLYGRRNVLRPTSVRPSPSMAMQESQYCLSMTSVVLLFSMSCCVSLTATHYDSTSKAGTHGRAGRKSLLAPTSLSKNSIRT